MKVTVRYYGFFSRVTGRLFEEADLPEGSMVKDLTDRLAGAYGYRFERLLNIRPLYSEREYINVCINTQDLNASRKFPDGIQTRLCEGDVVSFGVMGGAA